MAKCPNCGEEIDKLINQTAATVFYECEPMENHPYLNYREIETLFLSGDGHYFCPECDEVVAKSEAEAYALLTKRENRKHGRREDSV